MAAVYDFGEADASDGSGVARPYLVMELVDGQPLSALLEPGQPLDPEATRDLLAQAADALGAAHAAGIVHRDVKPANLLVTPGRTVKITDFGIARAAEGMSLTETGQVMGTPQYLSPEQAQGGTATSASDVYSLGVVAFECLAGRRPYVAESAVATALAHLREPVPELPDDVPADLAAVVRRAMAKAPEDRYADATEFAAALRNPAAAATPDRTQVLTGVAPVPVPATAPTTGPTPTPAAATQRKKRCRGPGSCSASSWSRPSWRWSCWPAPTRTSQNRPRPSAASRRPSPPSRTPRPRSSRRAHRLRPRRTTRCRWTSPTTSAVTSTRSRTSCRTSG